MEENGAQVNIFHIKIITSEKYNLKNCKVTACNLYYGIRSRLTVNTILKDISFQVEAGELCAIMGASGAGKRYK
jgi:ABC-type multidrug transport system ATPase subunit